MTDANPEIGRGAFWNGVTAAANQVIRFGLFVVLARLVTPAELGLAALGMVVIDLVQTLATAGIGEAVVQQPDLDDGDASTAFWLSLGVGAAAALTIVLAAPVIGWAFGKPALAPVVRWLSLIFLLTPLQTVHMARMARAFRFRQIALRMLIANLVGGGVGVALALRGGGVWALVGRSLTVPLVATAFLWIVYPWRPQWRFRTAVARRQLGFGAQVIGGELVTVLKARWIDLIAGLLLAPAALGLLRVGGQCTMLLLELTMVPFIHLALPILSRAGQEGAARPAAAEYLQLARLSAATIFPAFFGTAAVASLLFPLMFGARWAAAGALMPALCAIAAPLQLTLLVAPALASAGRPGEALRWSVLQLAAMAPCTLVGAWFGLFPLAWSAVIGSALTVPAGLLRLHRVLDVAPRLVLAGTVRPFVAATVMAVLVWGEKRAMLDQVPALGALASCIASGLVLYPLLLLMMDRRIVADFRSGGPRNAAPILPDKPIA